MLLYIYNIHIEFKSDRCKSQIEGNLKYPRLDFFRIAGGDATRPETVKIHHGSLAWRLIRTLTCL
jgi:hypothetical protein